MRYSLQLFFFVLLGVNQAIQAKCADEINFEDAYIRSPIPGQMATAGFVTLMNKSQNDCQLIRVQSQISKVTELHTHKMHEGVMKMREVKSIDIAAGNEVKLAPGSLHIMFIGLNNEPFKDVVPLDLHFADGSHIKKNFPIKSMLTHKKKSHHHVH